MGPLSVQRAVFLLLPGKIWWARERVGEKAGGGGASFVTFSHSWETGYFWLLLILFFPSLSLDFEMEASWFHLDKFSPILIWVQLGAC